MTTLILLALIVNFIFLYTLWKRTNSDIGEVQSDIKKLRKRTGLDKHESELSDLMLEDK